MKVVAKKIDNPNCTYLTEGKVYDISIKINKYGFYIVADDGNDICCRFKNCSHIRGDWTIIGNHAVVVK